MVSKTNTMKAILTLFKNTVNLIWFYIQISRPAHWPILPLIFLLGLSDARGYYNLQIWLQVFALSFPLELYLNSLNDIFDQETDLNNPRKNSFWLGKPLQNKDIKKAIIGAVLGFVIVLAIAISTLKLENIIWASIGLLFGLIYSLPPVRLKERPLLSLSAYGFGFLGAYFMGFTMFYSTLQAGIKPWVLSLLIIALGSLAFLADYASDLKAKQKTIATKYGEKFTLNLVLICYLIVLILRPFVSLVSLLYLIFSVVLIIYLKWKPTQNMIKITLYSLASFGGIAIFLATVFKF